MGGARSEPEQRTAAGSDRALLAGRRRDVVAGVVGVDAVLVFFALFVHFVVSGIELTTKDVKATKAGGEVLGRARRDSLRIGGRIGLVGSDSGSQESAQPTVAALWRGGVTDWMFLA